MDNNKRAYSIWAIDDAGEKQSADEVAADMCLCTKTTHIILCLNFLLFTTSYLCIVFSGRHSDNLTKPII